MKKLPFLLCLFCLVLPAAAQAAEKAYAAPDKTQDLAQMLDEDLSRTRPVVDYLSNKKIPLTPQEQEILKLSQEWAKNPSKPVLLPSGKVAFLHGASIPRIIASPFNICDLELDAGESVEKVLMGDTARWELAEGMVGNTPHIFFKPMDAGLETNCVITTNRRVYHLRLASQRDGYMAYVGFRYQDKLSNALQARRDEVEKQEHFNSTVIDGKQVNLTDLQFGYKVSGNAKWRPEQVYSDGDKTYIRLPAKTQEMPVLLAKSGGDVVVNYRVQNNTFIVDGTFDELILILGVGSSQEKVTIKKQ